MKKAEVVMIQREVPDYVNDAVLKAVSDVKEERNINKGLPVVIIDLGGKMGGMELPKGLREGTVDWVTGNVQEWSTMLGFSSVDVEKVNEGVKKYLSETKEVQGAVVTLGVDGVVMHCPDDSSIPIPVPIKCSPVDPTGAGDCWRGAFGGGVARGMNVKNAARWGNAAAAVSTERVGAWTPGSEEVEIRIRGGIGVRGGGGRGEFMGGFGSRLNSMKDRRELTEHGDDLVGWIRRMGECGGVDLIDFNSPQHVGEGTDLELVKREIDKAGLKAGAVCLRYPKTMIRGGEEEWELGRNSRFGLGKFYSFRT